MNAALIILGLFFSVASILGTVYDLIFGYNPIMWIIFGFIAIILVQVGKRKKKESPNK